MRSTGVLTRWMDLERNICKLLYNIYLIKLKIEEMLSGQEVQTIYPFYLEPELRLRKTYFHEFVCK